MQPNLVSFCLSSTYDVLPSPGNLKRWRICTEASCFLCEKKLCNTAHILGACKTALAQGGFTFRHDSVLKEIVELLTTFCKSITSPVKQLNSIKFVKAGAHTHGKKSKLTSLLHLACDWMIMSDLKDGFVFPGHIALTPLRPDLVIYTNNRKHVIVIELTCPCEENMETWHSTKMSKYNPLVNIIKQNGWHIDLFAIEVGARGYCSRSVSSCLKRLGLDRKKTFQAARQLGDMCMKASFCIWVARNTKVWNEHSHIPISTSCSIPTPLMPKAKQPTVTKPNRPVKAGPDPPTHSKVIHAGLINKGNTCDATSILQALTAIPSF
ncbi:uncharacterized protein LOC130642351 [Hydractinia symbiolongicarpus]|uniref:uncharacterized protein LOC130642351 n=1 Tax=Hydractinia symbiolongicarpus TaxID=13093 RepID=UPI00254A7368|nr:uncharacterized protein LOC130642351 [Hydractinia symbiolongicarpus]